MSSISHFFDIVQGIRNEDGNLPTLIISYTLFSHHRMHMSIMEGNFDIRGGVVATTNKQKLMKKWTDAVNNGGIMVRRFTPRIVNGFPVKRLSAYTVCKERVIRATPEDVEESSNTDSITGERLEREELVEYE